MGAPDDPSNQQDGSSAGARWHYPAETVDGFDQLWPGGLFNKGWAGMDGNRTHPGRLTAPRKRF